MTELTSYWMWPFDERLPVSVQDLRPWQRLEPESVRHFYEALLGKPVVILPTARYAILRVLEWWGLNRGQTVFAPKWVSHCVWSQVTVLANPSTTYSADNDVSICVHHFSYVHKVPESFPGKVIEDSVDSFFTGGGSLFPNNGEFEVVSLPKLLGTRGGGLLIFRDPSLRNEWVKWERERPGQVATKIESCLPLEDAYARNQETIERRLATAEQRLAGRIFPVRSAHRLPPVLPVLLSETRKLPDHLQGRRFNVNRRIDQPDFQLAALVPLHFGADESTFMHALDSIERLI